MGIHARGGDLGEDMGTGGEEDEEGQKEGEKDLFHGGLRSVDLGGDLKMTEPWVGGVGHDGLGGSVLWGIIAWLGGFVKVWRERRGYSARIFGETGETGTASPLCPTRT
jgi:hypothetical protein